MTGILETLSSHFQFMFVRYALIVGILIALCASLLGVTLVLKRFSFIGDGLSHVAFGGIAIAAAFSLTNNFLVVLVVTTVSSILLLRTGQSTLIKGDAALAMLSVSALGIGYLILNVFSTSANLGGDVCEALFGSISILTLSMVDVWLSIVLSVLVIAIFLLFYHKIFSITFDEDFSTATGTKAKSYNLMLAIVIAVIISLAINLVGALLISALVIFPAMSAMRVFKSFRSVTICAVFFSMVCAAIGIIISILVETPVGSTIVAVNLMGFGMFSLTGRMCKVA